LLSPILSRLICAPSSQPKAVSGKSATAKHKFVIDYSRPANDEVFDGADFEKYMHDHIKVDGKAGQLGENVKVTRDGTLRAVCFIIILDCLLFAAANSKITVTSNIPFSKRYLKYLTKRFLKKNSLRDWIRYAIRVLLALSFHHSNLIHRVVASSKDHYQLRFYNIAFVHSLLCQYILDS
jgi:large subunit ribosomal protein L22e